MAWILWAIVGAALVHVAEEYWGGWLDWVRGFVPGVTRAQFAAVNTSFVLLCIVGAIIRTRNLTFSLSLAGLIFVNALIRLVPTIRFRRYSPGVLSAVVLCLPLSVCAYYAALASAKLTLGHGVGSTVLGLLWMAVPLGFQWVRLRFFHRQGGIGSR